MTTEEKQRVKDKIIEGNELYKLKDSRVKRILKNPFRTIPYFVMNAIAHIHPYRVNYKTFWGDRLSFFLPEGNAIYYYGFFEANLTNFFINFLREGDVFYDVGAHVGYYTTLGSNLVGNSGQVHSFEPTPRTFQSLAANVRDKINVCVHNNAVMDTETEIEFSDYGPKFSAFNSYKNRVGVDVGFLPSPEKVNVRTISLDAYTEKNNLKPTLIKIDAEGAEHIILQAMTNILSTHKPVVTIEVAGNDEWKNNCHDSIALLKKYGYVGYEISLEGYLRAHEEQQTYNYDNLVFAHPHNSERIKALMRK